MQIEEIKKQLEELGVDKDKIEKYTQGTINYKKLIELASQIEVKEDVLEKQIEKFEKIANVINALKSAESDNVGDHDEMGEKGDEKELRPISIER